MYHKTDSTLPGGNFQKPGYTCLVLWTRFLGFFRNLKYSEWIVIVFLEIHSVLAMNTIVLLLGFGMNGVGLTAFFLELVFHECCVIRKSGQDSRRYFRRWIVEHARAPNCEETRHDGRVSPQFGARACL